MSTQVSPKPSGKHDAYIAAQLTRAEQRIRLIDLTTGLCGFLAGTLLFAVVVVLLDGAVTLSTPTRQVLLLLYLLGSGVYLYLAVLRPLRWQVNSRYAARLLERTMPGRRNHLVNWVDLREQPLPGVIRNSLGQRTVKGLAEADVDQAISNRRVWTAAAFVGVAATLLLLLMVTFGPTIFGAHLSRAFAPFGSSRIPPRTQINLVRPASGDIVVTIGQAVTMVAQVEGRIPSPRDGDAPCLLWRHEEGEPYRKRFLQYDETTREWLATIAPAEVGSGFVYRLTAGDAETPEYRVSTRAAPHIVDFLATYHYRGYVGRASRSTTTRRLEALRGTEVHILARTNRVLNEGRFDFEVEGGGGDLIRAELLPDDPKAMRFKVVLNRTGKYRLRFAPRDSEGENYLDPLAYDVIVQPDNPPTVRLTQPEKDLEVPANGHVDFRGEIADDIGVADVTLKMQVVGGQALKEIPYLADRLGKPDFGTPIKLEYRELVELAKLQDASGKPFPVQPGMTLECWVQARDGCDYPGPNIGESKPRRRIVIAKPNEDAAQQKNRDKARKEKEDHDKKQQNDLKNQQAEKDKQRQQDEAEERAEAERREKEKQGQQPGNGEKSPANQEQRDRGKDEQTQRTAEDIQNELDRREREQQEKENAQAGQGRDSGKENETSKPGEGKSGKDKQEKPGKSRDQGKNADGKGPGEKKESDKNGQSGNQGQSRDPGQTSDKTPPGESRPASSPPTGSKPGEGKSSNSPAENTQPGQSRDQGKPDASSKPGEGKPQGEKPDRPGQGRDSQTARNPSNREACPCEGKNGAGSGNPGQGSGKAGSGNTGNAGTGKSSPPGQQATNKGGSKDGPPGNTAGSAREGSNPGNKPRAPENATPGDVKSRAKDLNSGDDGTRQAAAQDLKDIAERATDKNARKSAKDALDKAREEFNKGDTNKPDNTGNLPEKPEDATGETVQQLAKQAAGNKPGASQARRQLDEIGKKAKDDKTRQAAQDALNGAWEEWLKDDNERPKREKPLASRPGMLQLDEFRKKVDPNILKDLKMSREQFEQFLRDYADLAKRQPLASNQEDKLPGVGRSSGTLPGMGGQRMGPDTSASDNLRSSGRGKPPPEYRDSHRDFLNRLNTPR